jgi:transposase
MSTSLLYHAFGVRGYQHVRTYYAGRQVRFRIEQEPGALCCPECGSADVICRGYHERWFRSVPIGSKEVVVIFPVPRVTCRHCGGVRQVEVPFAEVRRTYTRAFERYALELSQHMTVQDVAHHLGISWDVIKEIQKRYLKRRFGRPKLRHLRCIAIDEISIGRHHRYVTVVLDLASGAVIYVGQGKGADALTELWHKLRSAGARITAVAMDMSPAYIEAVQTNLPGTVIVFDHFHVIRLYNEKLSDLRRELQREVTEVQHKQALKGTRWLLLKNPENLDERHNERQRLEEALRLNKPLATAYYMKEDLRQFWSQPDKAAATAFLEDWTARAQVSGVRMLQDFAKTLAGHRSGLLAYYDHPITTAALEGTNTKIRLLQRQAFGFRDMEFFKLKIMGLHESKIALVG